MLLDVGEMESRRWKMNASYFLMQVWQRRFVDDSIVESENIHYFQCCLSHRHDYCKM